MKRILSFILSFIFIASSFTVFVSAKNKDQLPSKIQYQNYNLNDISNNKLEIRDKEKLTLVENGKSDFEILITEKTDVGIEKAIGTLKSVIFKMSGYKLPISKNEIKGKKYIKISYGDISRDDGYKVIIKNNYINIIGNNNIGARNGVYGFIEDYLGCMFLTAKDTFIPKHNSIYLDFCENIHTPKMLWRDVYSYEVSFDSWADKLRLNGIDSTTNPPKDNIEINHHWDWGTWCHNCFSFLSPEDYFDKHPEYFSEFKGKRITENNGIGTYLCLSNPEVYNIVKDNLREKIIENPDKKYWDFSGNDNYSVKGCQCENCQKFDKAAGGTGMGTLLPFLNKLAEEFPDKYISTLAYLHTVEAPKNIKAAPNVVIKLCSMPGDQSYSYLNGGTKTADDFNKQVKDWAKIADKIVVWDYIVNFSNLLLPFPNFAVQAQNQKFYEDNGVIGVFHQGSREKGGEFAEMRSYVLARLMWEGSSMDVGDLVSRYVTAYYGKAAPKVIEYINLLNDSLYNSKNTLGLYDSPEFHRNDYLSLENVLKYKEFLDEGKNLVKNDKVYLERLDKIEIPILYSLITCPDIKEGKREEFKENLNKLCEKYEITKVREWQTKEDFLNNDYYTNIENELFNRQKPYIITFSVIGGIALIFIIAFVIFKIRKKKKLDK